jgi:hypothetical protein
MIVWRGNGNTGGRYCGPFSTVSYDFNGDGHPDYVLSNVSTHQSAIWYLYHHVYLNGSYGPTLPAAIWYLNNNVYIVGVYGPTPPNGWELVATADFNGDGNPDYVLYGAATRQTAIWYLNNNIYVSGAYGPTLPAGWSLVGLADFNGDRKSDYLLFNSTTRQSAIWYLNK